MLMLEKKINSLIPYNYVFVQSDKLKRDRWLLIKWVSSSKSAVSGYIINEIMHLHTSMLYVHNSSIP